MCNKEIIKDPTTPQARRYTAFQNSHWLQSHQRKSMRARTEENVAMLDKPVPSQKTNHKFMIKHAQHHSLMSYRSFFNRDHSLREEYWKFDWSKLLCRA